MQYDELSPSVRRPACYRRARGEAGSRVRKAACPGEARRRRSCAVVRAARVSLSCARRRRVARVNVMRACCRRRHGLRSRPHCCHRHGRRRPCGGGVLPPEPRVARRRRLVAVAWRGRCRADSLTWRCGAAFACAERCASWCLVRPECEASHSGRPKIRKWDTRELEVLALIATLEHFHHFADGQKLYLPRLTTRTSLGWDR